MLTVPNYGDPEAILSIGSKECIDTEKLCDILDEVTIYDWFTFAPYITDVNPELLDNISNTATKNLPDEYERELIDVKRDRYNTFTEELGNLFATRLLQEGTRFNSPIEYLLREVSDELEELSSKPKELAQEIGALVLLSDVPAEEVVKTTKGLLEDYCLDINVLTKAIVFIKDI